MKIRIDDLHHPDVIALIEEHVRDMYASSPPKSVHALDVSKLLGPDVTFWTVWEGWLLLGCGALKELDPSHGEIKSMRTPAALRRRGVGHAVLAHIIARRGARAVTSG